MTKGWVIEDAHGNSRPYSRANVIRALKAALNTRECACATPGRLGHDHSPTDGVCACGLHAAHTHCAACGGIIEIR